MDQIQIDVLEPQALKASVEGVERLIVAVVIVPQLGGHEHLAAVELAARDGLADSLLVPVGGSGVDRAVTHLEGGGDGVRGVLLWNLEDTKAELRDLVAVGEVEVGDVCVFGVCGHAEVLPRAPAAETRPRG